ncbi:hypothetical protein EXIGLDRAFT_758079 [Exidia glandulosa HHB12029]|uniref:Uncharacterized protein n=1 Tax=Exidia glandulosa HHB12029 TaxID=1314781 RepID=A0A165QKK5_EXIGL|nr:hypothetical protein EXIGLDRAFT_758079 [Exidia glandulosa HHB12029]
MEDLPFPPQPDPRLAFLKSLPVVDLSDVKPDDNCPICLVPFDAICCEPGEQVEIAEDEYIQCAGLTKLPNCTHIFCKKDLVEWINTSHGSCPSCRDVFLEFPREEDIESSDGGEYIPDDDEEMGTDYDYDGFGTDGDVYTEDDLDMSDWGDAAEEDDYSFSSDPASATNDDDDDSDACAEADMSGVLEPQP